MTTNPKDVGPSEQQRRGYNRNLTNQRKMTHYLLTATSRQTNRSSSRLHGRRKEMVDVEWKVEEGIWAELLSKRRSEMRQGNERQLRQVSKTKLTALEYRTG